MESGAISLRRRLACLSGDQSQELLQGSIAKKLKFSWGFLVDAKDYIFSSAIHLQIAQCSFTISSGRFSCVFSCPFGGSFSYLTQ
ncbi:hypothetical [Prochlorococcus marinus str. MIT 9313]|uniref:Uncharacterized protein n=1 Tax=Prochlorococcus marinus (strain MIT 9313) TaxID=74547 RepID=Q7V5M0_PROMM|nr:hypothetical [Prochlorococcus marinus str. MIT 9313]